MLTNAKRLLAMCICVGMLMLAGGSFNEVEASTSDETDVPYVCYNYKTKEEFIRYFPQSTSDDVATISAEGERISPPYDVSTAMNESVLPYDMVPGKEISVVDATQSPYSKIVFLDLGTDTNGDYVSDVWVGGTGVLVGPDVIVTAGHCMYDSTAKKNVFEMRIRVQQNSNTKNSIYYHPAEWVIGPAYKSSGNWEYDWCVIELDQKIGNQVGYMGFGVASGAKEVTVSGYPDIDGYRYFQYCCSGTLSIISDKLCNYDISTLGGQSGGPAFDSGQIVWAVHSGTGGAQKYNRGVLITDEVFSIISSYKTND